MLARAQELSASIVGSMNTMQRQLEVSNAFLEHTEGTLRIAHG